MITKTKLLESIKDMPEIFSSEEIIERVILLNKIDIGIEQSNNNEVISDDELDTWIAQK